MAINMTQRAYTLRLKGAAPGDTSWQNALWTTHVAVNKGVKTFGVGRPTGDVHAGG
jgi:hypothetical protein